MRVGRQRGKAKCCKAQHQLIAFSRRSAFSEPLFFQEMLKGCSKKIKATWLKWSMLCLTGSLCYIVYILWSNHLVLCLTSFLWLKVSWPERTFVKLVLIRKKIWMAAKFGERLILVLSNDINKWSAGGGGVGLIWWIKKWIAVCV